MLRWRLPLSLITAIALVMNPLSNLPADAVAPVVQSASDEFVANDFVSAQVKAKALHHRILVTGELSEVSTTWVNVDGTSTVDVSGSPVRVRDASGLYGWRDLDFDLVATDSGVVAKSGLLPLTLSPGGTTGADVLVEEGLTRGTSALRGVGESRNYESRGVFRHKANGRKFKSGGISGGHYFYH